MELRILGRRLPISAGRSIGLALAVLGAVLLIAAYNAQIKINDIGATNDPVLQNRLANLSDQRDTLFVSSIGMLFLGVFGTIVLGEPSAPRAVSEAQMIGTARAANEMVAGLSLAGNSSYLPARHGLTKERMFISAPMNGRTPPAALSDDLVLSPGKDGSTPGLLLEPYGLDLMNLIETDLGTSLDNAGLEAAEGILQMLKHGFDMMKDFHFKERDGNTILRVEYDSLREACRTVRKENPDTCRRVQCIGCSCLLTAATKSTGKVVHVTNVDNSQDAVVFTLALSEW